MKPEAIEIPVWWSAGGRSIRRDCLSPSHPEHTYNYIKRELKVDPEDYGVFHPDIEDCKDMTREELVVEVMKLKSELRSWRMREW